MSKTIENNVDIDYVDLVKIMSKALSFAVDAGCGIVVEHNNEKYVVSNTNEAVFVSNISDIENLVIPSEVKVKIK